MNSSDFSSNNSTATSSRLSLAPVLGLHGFALLGITISIFLTEHFYAVRGGTAGFKSFCTLNSTFNCDTVAASPWAELFFGLPLAGFSAGWLIALFIISLMLHLPRWRTAALKTCFGITLTGLCIGLTYALIMIFKIKSYCLMCFGVDLITFGALACVLWLKPFAILQPPAVHSSTFHPYRVCIGILVSVLFVTLGLLKIIESSPFSEADLNQAAETILQSPMISVHTDDIFPSIGPKNAPITIIEFSDFQCPFCRIAALSLHSVTQRYPNQIRIIFRHFPLDQQCNRSMQQSMHPVACEAARVAHCSHQQGKFESIYEALFENQDRFAAGQITPLATAQGVNSADLQSCMRSDSTSSAIAHDIEEGLVLEIKSTPTFFVNGHKLEGAIPAPVWNRIIDQLLKNKNSPVSTP